MKPTDVLKEEHRLVLEMLKVIGAVCAKLDKGEAVDAGHLASIIDFIRTFTDQCHHAKEEKLLFPALAKVGLPATDGPVAVMLREHALGRSLVRSMDEALAAMKKGDVGGAAAFAENARKYIELLGNHIDKEDHVLFVMADQRLSPGAQEELMAGFDRVEREETGEGVHEKYHALLHRLRDLYLSTAT